MMICEGLAFDARIAPRADGPLHLGTMNAGLEAKQVQFDAWRRLAQDSARQLEEHSRPRPRGVCPPVDASKSHVAPTSEGPEDEEGTEWPEGAKGWEDDVVPKE
eukprot:702202-Alexandrium_andersonii.AAC.1